MNVRLHTLGCRLNEAELEAWARAFLAHGCELVEDAQAPADLIVINTCAVTAEAVRKSRQLVRRARRVQPAARVIVSGCWATLDPTAAAAAADLVILNQDKDQLVEIARAALNLTGDSRSAATALDLSVPLFARGRQRAFIKIQDGCRYQCTFCITTHARGAERSRPPSEIVREVSQFEHAGVQEVVLTGVQLGGYRADDGTDLTGLLERLLRDTAIARIRLGSLEPWDLPERLWALFSDQRLMPHLHLPLQSGSDAVLKRMARRCKRAEYLQLVERARQAIPNLNLTTDIIVGFPGETDADWQHTLELAVSVGFGDIHAFGYSPRPGTLAAGLSEPVARQTRQARLAALDAVARQSRLDLMRAQIGQAVPVLHERVPTLPAATALRSGYTPNYLPVQVRSATPMCEGQVVMVRLMDLDPAAEVLVGEVVPRCSIDARRAV